MVKNICQVSQPMDKILSFKVFQEWVFFFFQKKMNILPLVRTSTSGLVLFKPTNFCVVEKHFIFCSHFLTESFKNVMIQRPASDKVDDFYGC
jgi:hypothetical protein